MFLLSTGFNALPIKFEYSYTVDISQVHSKTSIPLVTY